MFRLKLAYFPLLLALAALLACSCAQSYVFAENEYLLSKNKIIVTNSRTYPKSELSAYLKQTDKANQNMGLRWLFAKPVLFDDQLITPSRNGMLRHLEYQGYYNSRIDTAVVRKNHKATVKYIVTLGKQYPVKEITYAIADSTIRQIYEEDTPNHTLKIGDPVSEENLEKEAERIATLLRSKGYYGFSKNYMFNFADTTAVRDTALLKVELRNYTRNETPSQARKLTPYTVRNVRYEMPRNMNVRRDFLDNINLIKSGTMYSEELINTTYQRFAGNHIFNTVNISLTPVDSTSQVDCLITLTPSKLQNFEVNMDASTNSSGLIGLTPSFTYNHFNIFHGGEVFTLGFRGNFQFKINDPARSNEYAITAGLKFPRLLLLPFIGSRTPVLPSTDISLAYNYQNRPEYTRYILSGTYGYSWSKSRNLRYSVSFPHLSIIKISDIDHDFYTNLNSNYLQYQYQDHFDMGATASVYFTTDATVNPKNSYFYLRGDASSSGLVMSSMNALWNENRRGQKLVWGIPYSQYLRAQVSAVETLRFGRENKMALATRFLAGIGYAYGNSLFSMPLEQMFYAGGANSMRGWQSRTVGPGMAPLDEQFLIYNQVGDMRLEANIEWRFPLFWKLDGALFTDVGNVWNIPKRPDFMDEEYLLSVFSFKNLAKSTAMSWGAGARLDFGLLLIRVDLGIKGYDPEIQRWLAPKEWFGKNGFAVHLGIGYPF
jgi:outer membrane protein assembly factor BamA